MEKFRSPIPRVAGARKHQANGCSRAGREKSALKAAGDEAACHELACNQKQMWGYCTREEQAKSWEIPAQEVTPAQAVTLLIWVQSHSIRAETETGPEMKPHPWRFKGRLDRALGSLSCRVVALPMAQGWG